MANFLSLIPPIAAFIVLFGFPSLSHAGARVLVSNSFQTTHGSCPGTNTLAFQQNCLVTVAAVGGDCVGKTLVEWVYNGTTTYTSWMRFTTWTAACNSGAAEGPPTQGQSTFGTIAACQANATCSGMVFTCNFGFIENGLLCGTTPVPGCTVGSPFSGFISITSSPSLVCFGSCQAAISQASDQAASGGVQVIKGTWTGTGQACMGSDAAGTTGDPSIVCSAGLCMGTFNGAKKCLPCSAAVPGTVTTGQLTTNKDASGNVTNTTNSTTTTTINGGGGSTTTTTDTTRNAAGGVTGSQTKTSGDSKKQSDMGQFCAENPQSPLCKVSAFTGACSPGAFTFDGDAIQGQIAKKISEGNCIMFETETPLTVKGNAAVDAGDLPGDHPGKAANRTSIAMASTLDQSPFLGGGGLTDQTIGLMQGQSLVIPWSQLTPAVNAMGLIVLAFTLVAAVGIVGLRA